GRSDRFGNNVVFTIADHEVIDLIITDGMRQVDHELLLVIHRAVMHAEAHVEDLADVDVRHLHHEIAAAVTEHDAGGIPAAGEGAVEQAHGMLLLADQVVEFHISTDTISIAIQY